MMKPSAYLFRVNRLCAALIPKNITDKKERRSMFEFIRGSFLLNNLQSKGIHPNPDIF